MTSGREQRECRLRARLERLVGAGAGPVVFGSFPVTEVGRALGARVSQSTPDPGSWVTTRGVTADARPRPVHAANYKPGRSGSWRGFSWFGKSGEWRLVTARWAAREGGSRLRIQVRRLIRELRAGEVTAVAVGSKSFFLNQWSHLRIRASALKVTGPVAQVQFHFLRKIMLVSLGCWGAWMKSWMQAWLV